MTEVCLSFEVHQPLRIDRNFTEDLTKGKMPNELFDIYFNNTWNRDIFKRVAERCYHPTNKIILENMDKFKHERRKFKVVFSLSGIFLEQCERWAPDVLNYFKQLSETDCVEFLCQTYFHSLSSLFSTDRSEFVEQVLMHQRLMRDLFGKNPKIFENTEFIYNNSIARTIADLGFQGIFTEGAERVLERGSPNFVYKAKDCDIRVLLRNYRLSDDISFRFSNRDWDGWPLTAEKYARWLSNTPGQCINIFMDYETFGEHQWSETGIHEFLKWLPAEILKYEHLQFATPSELIKHEPVGEIDVHDFDTLSWADVERSTNAWLGNDMQRTAFNAIKRLEPFVKRTKNESLLRTWRFLQTSDHIYYMYTTPGPSGFVHGYFSQQFPAEAFWAFMKIMSNFYEKVAENLGEDRTSAYLLRVVPPDRAFHFHENGVYINLSAHSLEELRDILPLVPDKSILFHTACKQFDNWIRLTIGDSKLADTISTIEVKTALNLRQELHSAVKRRVSELLAGLDK
jgi:alpha-amylase